MGKRGCICPKGNIPTGTYSSGKVSSERTSEYSHSERSISKPSVSQKTSLPLISKSTRSSKGHSANKQRIQSDAKETEGQIHERPRQLTLTEQALVLLSKDAEGDDSCGTVRIKFNHYNKEFPIYNGVLVWKHVDDVYSFSFVYRGNYRRDLIVLDANRVASDYSTRGNITALRDDLGNYFLGLSIDKSYQVDIEEDPIAGIGAEGLRIRDGPLKSQSSREHIRSGNTAFNDLTTELKAIKVENLSSQEAKDLIERRDVEDILFSS